MKYLALLFYEIFSIATLTFQNGWLIILNYKSYFFYDVIKRGLVDVD